MARNFMAHPELRHPFEETPVHPDGCATILYQGRRITLEEVGGVDRLLIRPEDLERVNGFEVKPQGACYGDLCIPLNDTLFVEREGRRW
ncbi:MAG: redoxin domain-containing (seleno)protein, partial [Pseudomonadales bacterium]|nr:redoxin domain-containing (seleno)protein [Pseudomonadales bacterium]